MGLFGNRSPRGGSRWGSGLGLAGVEAGVDRIKIDYNVLGVEESDRLFRQLNSKLQRKVTRKAINAAARPMVKRVRQLVPKKTGLLKRSITHRVKAYRRGGIQVAVIGQRGAGSKSTKALAAAQGRALMSRGNRGGISGKGKIVPIHLVDQPTKAHRIRPKVASAMAGDVLVFRRYGKINWESVVNHGGTRGYKFLARAFSGTSRQSLRAFETKFLNEVYAEASKISPTGK